ncbi:sensor histidine kinase [Perlabentimonas gracilis]|uniref:sensor histidine kinase n=1 Tax=Perlabentimonas gracilis TaxID=2715279 RepID=UPI00140DBE70|nr:sensor histidine kinase [Perlabentimonas gracilis]NHB67171.1 histidine kinase [Perlabentimonas gracilis]
MKRFIEPIIHIAIWLGLYISAIVFIRTIGPFNKIDGTLVAPITVGNIINAAIFYSITLFLIPRYANRNQLKHFIIGFVLVFAGFTLLETIVDFFLMVSLYSDTPEPFFGVLITNAVVHLLYASLALGYGFTRRWVVSENKKQELVREKLTAELNFLKTQLNPHFLFNVLNMAYSSASRKGDDQTADIIEKLSVLMRYMIYDSNVDKIEVEKEIDFIRNYINLQKMRFSSDLPVTVTFTVDGHYTGYRIAPLILIPFIENAFKYGVKLEQQSDILLAMNFQNGEMEFTARNPIFKNGHPVDSKNSGIGIKNTQKRLNILYPAKHKLSIDNNGKEFMVKLLLNLE